MDYKLAIERKIENNPYGDGVFPVGESPASIMILKESPDKIEAMNGIAFSNMHGSRIRGIAQETGLENESFYYTTAIKTECRAREQIREHYNAYWQPILQAEFKMVSPKYVIILGYLTEHVAEREGMQVIRLPINTKDREIRNVFAYIKNQMDKNKPHWEPGDGKHLE